MRRGTIGQGTGSRAEADLIGGVLAGNRDAEACFVTRFLPVVAAVVRRKAVPAAEREDLAQEVFRHLWEDDKRRLRQWQHRGHGSFAAFLFVVTERLIIDHWRVRRCGCGDDLRAGYAAAPPPEASADPAADVVSACHARRQVAALVCGMAALSPRDAALIRQRHLLGRSYREIAADLGMTVNHVGVALARAETRLREYVCRCHGDLFVFGEESATAAWSTAR